MTNELKALIHTSADLADNHVKLADKIQREPGLTWGVPGIDRKVLPMRGGDVTVLCARPGHGKTSLMAYHAKREAAQILARGKQNQETVVYITWEGTVDAIYTAVISGHGGYSISDYYWGRVPMDRVRTNVAQHGTMPVMMIGFSTLRKVSGATRMTLDVIFECIRVIAAEFGRRPTLVCMDYLQLIPARTSSERVSQVSDAIVGAKNLSMIMDVPFILGAQAARDVDKYQIKLPDMGDVQWSSQGEQHADKLFGLWMPGRTEPQDQQGRPPIIDVEGAKYEANDRLLMVRMLKQRGEHGRFTWGLHLAPELLQLGELEQRVDAQRIDIDF